MDFYPLLQTTGQTPLATAIMREAFDHHFERFRGPDDRPENEPNTMQLEHVVAFTDLLLAMDKLEEALLTIRRGQRWLQGRKAERHWDGFEDDREYDPPGTQREDMEEDGEGPEGFSLDTNLRHRLALVRLRLGNDDEAMVSTRR